MYVILLLLRIKLSDFLLGFSHNWIIETFLEKNVLDLRKIFLIGLSALCR